MKRLLLISFASGLLLGCRPQIEPIAFGKDMCHYCKMVISDGRFGAELVSDKGKVWKFDAVECLIDHQQNAEAEDIAFTQVVAYDGLRKLRSVDSVHFLLSPAIPSPMGANLSAFSDRKVAEKLLADLEAEGQFLDWEEVREMRTPK